MGAITAQLEQYLGGGSMIRKMFEAGIELKKKFGADNVYDFSLGNPDLPPPPQVKCALEKIAAKAGEKFAIGYMPNAGYPVLREALGAKLGAEQHTALAGKDVLLTCGAAGGMNIFLHAVLEKDDEVVVPSPYFVEYGFYVANHGGKLIPVPTHDFTFSLDLEALEKAFNEKTRAVIINSPNNPTGCIYSESELKALARIIAEKEKLYGRTIYLISDEPYKFLNFSGKEIPAVFDIFPHAVIIGSFSKNLSLAGERIGFVAVNPAIPEADKLMNGLIFCNRTFGFVNAPAIGQQILLEALDAQVDLAIYSRRRENMAKVLTDAGVEFTLPAGAFYFFAKSPVADEKIFVDALLKEHILVVPGSGFGCSGYVRIAFCVEDSVILGSAVGFRRVMQSFGAAE